jgi:hypothetical protein
MIYGLNFNRTPIPPAIKRKFAARIRMADKAGWWVLQGVATSFEESQRMLEQASNGRRKLHVEPRMTAGAPFCGIYTD